MTNSENRRSENRRIMIIGDLMLDKYTFGKVDRVNPEAPVSLLSIEKEEYQLGGAGNVLKNLLSLKLDCSFASLINPKDFAGKHLLKLFRNKKINFLFVSDNRPTTLKQRFIADPYKQQVLRVDYEKKHIISKKDSDKIINFIKKENLPY